MLAESRPTPREARLQVAAKMADAKSKATKSGPEGQPIDAQKQAAGVTGMEERRGDSAARRRKKGKPINTGLLACGSESERHMRSKGQEAPPPINIRDTNDAEAPPRRPRSPQEGGKKTSSD